MIERVRSGWEELQSLNHDSCPTHDLNLTVCLLLRLAVGRDDRVGHARGVGTGYCNTRTASCYFPCSLFVP